MALIRKTNPEWFPSENRGLAVGESIDITDYRRLVELGMAELIDEDGNVLPLPGTVFVCAICFETIDNHGDYVEHILTKHPQKKENAVTPTPKEEPKDEKSSVKVPESFGEKMAKAREAARKKREALKEAKA